MGCTGPPRKLSPPVQLLVQTHWPRAHLLANLVARQSLPTPQVHRHCHRRGPVSQAADHIARPYHDNYPAGAASIPPLLYRAHFGWLVRLRWPPDPTRPMTVSDEDDALTDGCPRSPTNWAPRGSRCRHRWWICVPRLDVAAKLYDLFIALRFLQMARSTDGEQTFCEGLPVTLFEGRRCAAAPPPRSRLYTRAPLGPNFLMAISLAVRPSTSFVVRVFAPHAVNWRAP